MTDHDDHDDAAKSILLFCNLSPLLEIWVKLKLYFERMDCVQQ